MTDYKCFEINTEGFVFEVFINRPQKSNSLSADFWKELKPLFEEIDQNKNIRTVVLSARGKGFSAGLDFMSFAQEIPGFFDKENREAKTAFLKKAFELQDAVNAIEACQKPVIAAIHGYCIGAGLDIACACDIRLASKDAIFSLKETAMAVIPDLGSIDRLAFITGDGFAREMIFSAKTINAEEALRVKLVNNVFETQEALLKSAKELAHQIAENAPGAVQLTKKAISSARRSYIEANMRYSAELNSQILPSDDLLEAVSAMLEKRKPNFKGR